MSALAAFLARNTWIVVWRNFLAWRKYAPSSLAINLIDPVALFLALGLGLGAYMTLGKQGTLLQFIAPGLLGFLALNTATFDACWGGYERLNYSSVYESMVTTPVRPEEIAAGEYLWQAFRTLVYGALFLIIIAVFGLAHSWLALLCPLVLALAGILFAIPGLWVAMLVKTQEHLFFYFSFVVTPMAMVSGVFFPLDKMPLWLKDLAWWTPLYHAVNACRALLFGRLDQQVGEDLLWLVVAIALLAVLPVRTLRKRLAN